MEACPTNGAISRRDVRKERTRSAAYDLAPLASIAEVRHELLENRIWIEVLLGLVDNERALVVHVDGKIEQQENDAARSRRELFDRNAVVFDAVTILDVAGAFRNVRNAKLSEQTVRRFGAGRIA